MSIQSKIGRTKNYEHQLKVQLQIRVGYARDKSTSNFYSGSRNNASSQNGQIPVGESTLHSIQADHISRIVHKVDIYIAAGKNRRSSISSQELHMIKSL